MNPIENKKIEYWKSQLLDTGKRNKMINYRETARATLKIVEPGLDELYANYVQNENELTFEYPLDKDSDIRTYSVLRLFDRLSCPISVLLGDIKVATSFQESKKTLKNLRNKSKLALEEQGTNILYLSLGFIEWQENHGSHHSWVKSPLILVPVSLTVETLNAPFKLVYTCGTYRNKGKDYCTSHYIHYEDVYNCVLYDIYEKTLMIQEDKDGFYQAALKCNEKKIQEETRYQQARLKDLKKRFDDLDILIQKTYENSVLGTALSQERVTMLLTKYEEEQAELKASIEEIETELKTYHQSQNDARDFTELISKYIGIKELTAEIVIELIDRIEIGEKYIKDGQTYQDIDIQYRFVGKIAA